LSGREGEEGRRALLDSVLDDDSMDSVADYENEISYFFIKGLEKRDLLQSGEIELVGERYDCSRRTPTFALTLGPKFNGHAKFGSEDYRAFDLSGELNKRGIFCTHGNHYAPELVDGVLERPGGVTRVSFLHYNSLEEAEFVLDAIEEIVRAL
jgi:selenocysteine lyase/cysteine desulfurase